MNRVLIVDDDPIIIKSLRRLLRVNSFPCQIEGAESGAQALEILDSTDIDVVVTDMMMPGMDGIELLTRLKSKKSTQYIPVIMLTGLQDSKLKHLALDLGVTDFLNKPSEPEELIARLRNAIRMKNYQDQLAENLELLHKQLVQSQKMEIVGTLAAGISHDLRNILNTIILAMEVLSINMADKQEKPRELEIVLASAEHATTLVSQIVGLGHPLDSNRQPINLENTIDGCVQLIRATIPHDVALRWNRAELDFMVLAEKTQIYQILLNLCMNSVDAMNGKGQIDINLSYNKDSKNVRVKQGMDRPQYLQLTVADSGQGIESQFIDHIFDPFFTTKSPGRGTGLGLAVIKSIVDNLRGDISVESIPGKGTTFSINLPIHSGIDQPVPVA